MPSSSTPSALSFLSPLVSTEARLSGTIGVIVLSLGLLLGLTTAQSSSLPNTPWRLLSNIIGWTYFSAWSISFWPQILLNFQRGTVAGLSFEFLALNLLGFTCYTVYNGGLYWNPTIQAQYFAKTRKTSIPVESNDVFFGLHAVAVTLLTIIQCFTLKREAGQRLSLKWGLVTLGLCVFIAVYAAVVASGRGSSNTWLGGDNAWWTFALNISYVKLAISCCKYIPQVVINHRRRSTAGWSIHNVLLDFTGGLLSVVQQCGDAQATGDWAGIVGDNPVKFGLGFASMFFDIIFSLQHYVWYPNAEGSEGGLRGGEDRDGYSEEVGEQQDAPLMGGISSSSSTKQDPITP